MTLTSIIQTRKAARKSTFIAFVDFSKAYDKIDRKLLWQKLETLGIPVKFLQTLKALYNEVECCVRVNGRTSRWFQVNTGLKQGCLLSPILFNLYTGDLSIALKNAGNGVPVGDVKVCSLSYADDIGALSKSEMDL